MERFIGNYVGVVIQNNDPEMRGRIKVFVPNVSTCIYANWNQDTTDKVFNFVDNPDVHPIVDSLKEVLPWSEFAGPVFGGSASARYNATTKKGVVSDANVFEKGEPIKGYRPLNMYVNENAYPDAFSATGKVGNNSVNPYAYQYIPSNYSNLAKGMFSIPNVGSHVWVWFRDGDSNYPVFFASAYGAEDIKRIYTMSQKTGLEGADATSMDYPASYENIDTGALNSDSKTFRSKHVINSNKNSIELIDTDGREGLKLTHYSGSLLDMNNEATIKFSTANDQTMVLGDTFETHWKDKNEFIGGINDVIVQGDYYEKIGNLNSLSVGEIYEQYKSIHEYKMLFDVKRAERSTPQNKNVVSPFQTQDGTFAPCPVCKGLPYAQTYWRMSPLLERMCLYIPIVFPGFSGVDIFVAGIPPFLSSNGKIGYIEGRHCPLCNSKNPAFADTLNIGYSPSTENGFWNIESMKQIDGKLGDLYKSTTPQILDLQSTLGEGGDKINNISRNMVMNVGLVMNDLPSYRVDSIGKLKTTGMYLSPEKAFLYPTPTPHVEHVDVDALPGGDYIVTAGNKMKFIVGANGISIKTFGPIEMYGTITNLTSEQMNILAKHELFIDGGEKMTIRGRNISINPFEHNPVLVEGGLHVSRNMIIGGGAHIEGELGVQHITAPEEWVQTEGSGCLTMLVNTLLPIGPPSLEPHVHPVIIQIPDHKHWYKTIPMTLTKCKEEARDTLISLGINDNVSIKASDIKYPDDNGAISNVDEITSSLEAGGVDSQAVADMFDAINSAIDVTALEAVFSGATTNINSLGDSLDLMYATYRAELDSNLNEIQNAVNNSLSTITGGS